MGILIFLPIALLVFSLVSFFNKRKSIMKKFDENQKENLKTASKKTKSIRVALIILTVILTLVFFIFLGVGSELFCRSQMQRVPGETDPFKMYTFEKKFVVDWENLSFSAVIIPLDICLALFVSHCIYVLYLKKNKKLTEEERKVVLELNSGNIVLGVIISTISLIAKRFIYTVMTATVDKPIIYLYPEKEEKVKVKIKKKEILTHTYPKYSDGWNVTAYPDGTLEDVNGRKYYALYWEGKYNVKVDMTKGFCVKGEDTIEFLEEKLEKLGLNAREAQEFIVYWLPQLENNKYNYIYFKQTEEVNDITGLDITPKPDTIIRILIVFKPLNKEIEVEEQEIVTPDRKGFTVVEWGGSKI